MRVPAGRDHTRTFELKQLNRLLAQQQSFLDVIRSTLAAVGDRCAR